MRCDRLLIAGACLFVASLLTIAVLYAWAREEAPRMPAWRWGDAPRRQKRSPIWPHALGVCLALLAAAFLKHCWD